MKNKHVKNPFEDEHNAQEWIRAIETINTRPGNVRVTEVYPFLKDWVQEVQPKVIVEIGSGQGTCSDKLGEFKGRYIGVEPSKYLLQRARKLYGDKSNREFLTGDAYAIPLTNSVADAVFSVCVWFHLEDLGKAAQEMARILKPDGTFVIITGNPNSYHLWRSFFKDLEERDNKLIGTIDLDGGTIHNIILMHTYKELIHSFKSAGLAVDSEVDMGYAKEHKDQGIFITIKGRKK